MPLSAGTVLLLRGLGGRAAGHGAHGGPDQPLEGNDLRLQPRVPLCLPGQTCKLGQPCMRATELAHSSAYPCLYIWSKNVYMHASTEGPSCPAGWPRGQHLLRQLMQAARDVGHQRADLGVQDRQQRRALLGGHRARLPQRGHLRSARAAWRACVGAPAGLRGAAARCALLRRSPVGCQAALIPLMDVVGRQPVGLPQSRGLLLVRVPWPSAARILLISTKAMSLLATQSYNMLPSTGDSQAGSQAVRSHTRACVLTKSVTELPDAWYASADAAHRKRIWRDQAGRSRLRVVAPRPCDCCALPVRKGSKPLKKALRAKHAP